jgi:anti-sigma factor RsiW
VGFSTHLRCDQLVEIASDYLEKELSAADAERLEQHLLICGACTEYLAQIRAVRDGARKLLPAAEAELDRQSEQRLRSLLKRLKGEGGS